MNCFVKVVQYLNITDGVSQIANEKVYTQYTFQSRFQWYN